MTDQPKSTPPESWEQQPAFREHLLSFVPELQAEMLRRLGDFFFVLLLESEQVRHDSAAQLRGIAADLEAIGSSLEGLASDYEGAGLRNPMAGWRERVVEISREIGEAAS